MMLSIAAKINGTVGFLNSVARNYALHGFRPQSPVALAVGHMTPPR